MATMDFSMVNMGGQGQSGTLNMAGLDQSRSKTASGDSGGLMGGVSNLPPGANVGLSSVAQGAKATLGRASEELRNFIEQNPSQVRATIFLIGACQFIYCALGTFNIFSLSFTPVEYMVNVYLCLFAVVTLVLEGKSEWPGVARVQEKVFFQAHFLSTIPGRAMFYVFQGTFGLARFDDDPLMALFGLGFFAIGVLIVLQQWRVNRQEGQDLREQFVPAP